MALYKRLKNILWTWRGIAIAAPTISVIVIGLRLVGALEALELATLDQFFRWRSPEPADSRIIIIGIDEADIRKYNWPIDDQLLTQLLSRVKQQQPRAIGLDLARDQPIGKGYAALAELFKTTSYLIGATKKADLIDSNFDVSSSDIKPPPVLAELGQVGAVNLPIDDDGRIRRGLLSLQLPDGNVTLSFGLQLALLYLDKEQQVPFEAALNPPRLEPNDGGYRGVDVGGHQFVINYRRSQGYQIVRMADVLNGKVAPDLFRDRVVMIGVTAVSLRDWFFTPLDSGLGSTRIFTSGVEVHAQIVSHILSSTLDGRVTIQVWNEYWEALWIFGWALAGATLIWQWRNVNTKDRELLVIFWRSLSAFLLTNLLFWSCLIALNYGLWLPFAPAMIALLGGGAIVTSYLAITAAQIRTYFSRYLTDAVVKSLLETPEGLKLGGDRRKVTILMCDLRGFSSLSEKMPPEQVVDILNVFLGTMTEAIAPYQGTIDEFIGDAILVLFGAPIYREDDAARAVASAIAMQISMQTVNKKLAQMGLPEIAMGIGINTGEVVAGNIGSQSRAKYAVVGNHVNLTARIESYTVGGQILISESTYAEVEAIVKINGTMKVEPKGVSQPIAIYDVCGIDGDYNLELSSINESLQILPSPIPFTYRILEEKHLSTQVLTGEIQRLSLYGAEIITTQDIPVLTNLKIYIGDPQPEGEIYAKVLKHQQTSPIVLEQSISEDLSDYLVLENRLVVANSSQKYFRKSLYIHFTNVPSNLRDWIKEVNSKG
ncbi:MAG: adenylate/guanylate cyclase domain-containing protein [Oscillatoriales cyanobacterium CG2_30_44_21]|nr:MAG: adenylate/guanylate cyclase domain-containing protein [Oscillatoriales cyanobacterium CG2_30_44_21]